MYFAMTSSVMLPLVAIKYPRAQRCRPQNVRFSDRKSRISLVALLSLDRVHDAAWRERRWYVQQEVHMIRADVPLHVTARLPGLPYQVP